MSRVIIILSLCILAVPLISFATEETGIPRAALQHCFIAGEAIAVMAHIRDTGVPLGEMLLGYWTINPPTTSAIEKAEEQLGAMAYYYASWTPEQLHDKVVTICLKQKLTK